MKLRKMRKEKGISQTFLSNALGYKHPSGYSNIEHGRIDLSLAQAKVIAEILGCTTDELAEEEEVSTCA
jgi:transcriptional regulator with XRE-family HTH domain